MRLVADLETNGLLDTVTTIHCIAAKDIDTGEMHFFEPDRVEEGVRLLAAAEYLVFHNGARYDHPVLEKLYPQYHIDKAKVFDTLVATRLIYTNLREVDSGLLKKKQLPGSLFGSHRLEAWGYRLKLMKGEYVADFKARMGDAYEPGMEWLEYSPEMGEYNKQDVEVTHALWLKLEGKEYSPLALEIEHQIAWLMAQQERNGFPFDAPKAATLYAKLAQRRGELERALKDEFTFWFAPDGGVITPKVGNKTRGTVAGVPYQKIKVVEFNPSSRDHIADRLIKLYGWAPEVFTDGGKPKVDDEVMARLDYPPAPLITEFLMVQKRISQLAEGDQAWLKVEQGGKIHGSVNPNGAVTGRATHAYPNIAQVPSSGAPFGKDCRELFCVPEGWTFGGTDASGLELRCLAHFMARYDGGKYGDVLLNGDIHWANVQSMGLTDEKRDESNKLHKVYRDGGKTFIYGFLKSRGCTQGWVQKTV